MDAKTTGDKAFFEKLAQLQHDGKYWGSEGAVSLGKSYFSSLYRLSRSDLTTMSSLYYGAAGNAKARADRSFFSKLYWLVRGYLCLVTAEGFSDQAAKIGLADLTVQQLDVRQSILRKCKRLLEAKQCIREGLSRPIGDQESDGTRALLLVGLVDVMILLKDDRKAIGERILDARDYVAHIEPKKQVRILRALAEASLRLGDRRQAMEDAYKAFAIAKREGLHDQFIKLLPLAKLLGIQPHAFAA